MDTGWGRNLPPVLKPDTHKENWSERRKELYALIEENVYGKLPDAKAEVTAEIVQETRDYAGKAIAGEVRLTVTAAEFAFSFPVKYAFPIRKEASPVFVTLSFRPEVPDKYLPAEELIDNGFGLAVIYYKDVVNDNLRGDFSDGLGRAYYKGGARKADECGKIGMWAYAAHRTLDWLETRAEADKKHLMLIGHSRLGKTALWAGASDERIYATFINDSGAGGSAIARDKKGERVADFVRSGMWDWFCENYKKYADRENEMPFDMHYAVALIAPRLVCIGSATEDEWADPESECLSAKAASCVWEMLGKKGLVMDKDAAEADDCFLDGSVGYELRTGSHFLSRTDWLRYMEFAQKHMAEEK